MITTRIVGGLGNQLFQYCAGRALSLQHGVPLGVDVRAFDRYRHYPLGLGHFDIQGSINPPGLPATKSDGSIRYLWSKLRPVKSIYREPSLAYDPAFSSLGPECHLMGYWQSERYFRAHADQIRQDLRIVTPMGEQNAKVGEQIAGCMAVSLHIRRGDYVTNSKFNAVHGTCDIDYYHRAIRLIMDQTGEAPVVFAFSDDPDWVAENLKLPCEMVLVRHNDSDRNYADLDLMSRCQHHIIANSSFSWWGAWLNPNPDKIVVAPARWFADPSMSNPDILPPEWQPI
jgi:hypothetical protein